MTSPHRADIPGEPIADLVVDGDDRLRATGPEHPVTPSTGAPAGASAGMPVTPVQEGAARVPIPPTFNLARDRVRWAAIWAGLFTTLTSLLLLGLLGLAIGLSAGSAAAASGSRASTAGAAVWASVAMLAAFALGGYVAGTAAAVFDHRWGALNGALVFVVGLPVLLWLATTGLGAALALVGDFAGAFAIDPGRAREILRGAPNTALPALGGVPVRAAWTVLVGLLLGLAASAVGGALGVRRSVEQAR